MNNKSTASSSEPPVVGFIGGGNMAASIIGGLLSAGWPAQNIRVSDPQEKQRDSLTERFGICCFDDNVTCIDSADVVIFAVKPQVLRAAVESVAITLRENTPLLVSIVAGISCDDTLRWVGANLPFVRVMPNTPALVNQGVSGLFANKFASSKQKQLSESLMRAVGEVVWVQDEKLIDTVTGVSGSGPAYFFKLMELMMTEAVANGLSEQAAKTLVIQTALGAATLIQQSTSSPAELRRRVTSPGGTTEAGINAMEQAGIDDAIRGGVRAAVIRSSQLSTQFGDA
jgi:pyrroline-5-carboxylate reductase